MNYKKSIIFFLIILTCNLNIAWPTFNKQQKKQPADIITVMKDSYEATPCKDEELLLRFNSLQHALQIKTLIPLFETKNQSKETESWHIFYLRNPDAICVIRSHFDIASLESQTISFLQTLRMFLPETIAATLRFQKVFVDNVYGAIPCTHDILIKKFNTLQESLGILNKINLFEIDSNNNSSYSANMHAFYCGTSETVTIVNIPSFLKESNAVQDYILLHELRHHLQNTTNIAQSKVQEYMMSHAITEDQASEYDADIFALEHYSCLHCLYEIRASFFNFYCFQPYNQKGYLTDLGFDPFIQKAKLNPKLCTHHAITSICAYQK